MDANRTRMSVVEEVTLGTTPTTPRMRTARFTGETLAFKPTFVSSDEIRDDRMASDPVKVNETNSGPINGELSFPVDESPLSLWLKSLMCSTWLNTPFRDNDGVADSVITALTNTTDVATVTTGAAFVAGQLVRFTGFTASANTGVFKCTTGSATVPAFVGAGFVAEAAPPAAARMKVVGFMGAAADITALADGLGSTLLDFTTLGLAVGQWVKIGGAADATTFAFLVTAGLVARRNAWARITAIAATKLTLDNLPSGWTTDVGTGKTIQAFFGDQIKNGVDTKSCTIERGFMGQAVPTYIAQRGMVAGEGQFNFTTEDKAKYTITFSGMSGQASTTSLDSSPDAATTNAIMAAAVNVGRIAENGVCLGSPNWMQSLQISVNNNLRMINALDCDETIGPVDIGKGSFDVSINAPTQFGSDALLNKLFASTPTNINTRIAKNNQALIFAIPRITFTDGAPSATAKNTDAMLPLTGMASKDDLTSAHLILDRLEFYA
ncbi:phage tail tube protein [Mesorhizobium sp. M0768]|uniref:phage tail tube protein n=1 Tax=Mesorhizobium sp. M0768 TaxID=2956996 RepID=UPI00333981C4